MILRFFLPMGILLSLMNFSTSNTATAQTQRCSLWVDLYMGEPVSFDDMVDDLVESDVIYLGESHRLDRHHQFQLKIVNALIEQNKKVVLGLEPLEHVDQPALDQFNDGELSFSELAEEVNWKEQWSNYLDYQPLLEAVQTHEGQVVALNAPLQVIRKIGRQGLQSLAADERKHLPTEMNFEDPVYEKLLNQLLMVHMPLTKEQLKPVYHAQVARDETMAFQLVEAYRTHSDSDDWVAVVICGQGHCAYGMGMPTRVERRIPEIRQRIIAMSESGDVELTEQEKQMKRDIEITHEMLRFIQRPIGDYLHVVEEKIEENG